MKTKALVKQIARSKKQLPHRLKWKRQLIDCLQEALAAGTLEEALAGHPKLTKWLLKIKTRIETLMEKGHLWQEEKEVDMELLPLLSKIT
jgi:hypothetical protein